jgi:4-amino-4-deoxy-L-arabinose transferase-like glycosyltransferase
MLNMEAPKTKSAYTDIQKRWGVILLLLFLCMAKIPAMLTADIQPWDEGMYAARVNSIHVNGDFFDQTMYSVGGFESGVHPPLFIWLGYGVTSVFGQDEFVFKMIAFVFGLLCVVFIIKLGELIHSFEAGFLSAMIFSATYAFTVYAKRFQFDIAITFLFLLCFYLLMLYIERRQRKYFYWSAVMFGLCLMTKSLFGLFIPAIVFVFYVVSKHGERKINFSDIVILGLIGVTIAMPWHVYMYMKHGSEFTDYLLGFHLLKRATEGIGGNEKPSGVFYYFSILMNNIPFALVVFYVMIRDVMRFRSVDRKRIFLWVWFICGFVVISVFTTKIDTYLMPFLIPVCVLMTLYFFEKRERSRDEVFIVGMLVIVNLFWYLTPGIRNDIKAYVMTGIGAGATLATVLLIAGGMFFLSRKISPVSDLKRAYTFVVIIFFMVANIYYAFNVSAFEDGFKLAEITQISRDSGRHELIYISNEYEMNPQFSYYFGGIDLNSPGRYNYKLIDLKSGADSVRAVLGSLDKGKYLILLERDNINPGEEIPPEIFMPEGMKPVKETHGYQLYFN